MPANQTRLLAAPPGPSQEELARQIRNGEFANIFIVPVQIVQGVADYGVSKLSDNFGVLGPGINAFYDASKKQFSDPYLMEKVKALQDKQNTRNVTFRAQQNNFNNAVNSGFNQINSAVQNVTNEVVGPMPPPKK